MTIHSWAQVDAGAEIDPAAVVSAFSVIEAGVRIGPDTIIGPQCHILGRTTIGAGCELHSGVIVGGTPQDRVFLGKPSGCVIGDGTVIREHVTIHRGTSPGTITRIGNRCLLMVNAHVGHNSSVDDDAVLINGALLGGYVHVGARAVISGNVAVHQFVRVGDGAMVGALSKVTQDVIPYFMLDGPGLNVGINRVGLQRMGAVREDLAEVRRAYRVLCRERHTLPVARDILHSELNGNLSRTILAFLESASIRGFHLHSRDEGAKSQ
jgi:UDP-N-acetylglucosamine acyltransferase